MVSSDSRRSQISPRSPHHPSGFETYGFFPCHSINTLAHLCVRTASNILVDGNGDIRLSSFSLAKYSQGFSPDYHMDGFEKSKVDKFRHMAPEVCNNEAYGKPADVWSFGATLVEIVTGTGWICFGFLSVTIRWSDSGRAPYHDKTEANALLAISKSRSIEYEFPSESTMALKCFMHLCLKSDPRERATVNDLLADAFLAEM